MYFVYNINYNFYGNESDLIVIANKDISNKITEFKNINLNAIKTNIQPKKEDEYKKGISFKFDSYRVETLDILKQFIKDNDMKNLTIKKIVDDDMNENFLKAMEPIVKDYLKATDNLFHNNQNLQEKKY